ncbi:MAG: OmpA family protein [Proteobacteria bacterium]|nr:OmpA family protein [Pseudomonadota bacterium]
MMVTSSSMSRFVFTALAFLIVCHNAWAQEENNYDQGYDDDMAAGSYPYSDVEAAGEVSTDEPTESEDSTDAQWEEQGAYVGEEADSKRDELLPWEWGAERHHMNFSGQSGLFYMAEAGSDEAGTFGIGFHGAFFKYTDYLYYGDENSYMMGGLNLRVTPIDFLEAYIGIKSQANYNDANYPELFQTLGDLSFGVKGYYSPIDWITIGGLFGVSFMNPVGEVSVSFKGTSFDLGLLSTFDFTEINEKTPIRAHLNIGYFFDRSANLIEDIEILRGGCGTDIDTDGEIDFKGCLNPVERTALNINRNDQMKVGIGVDALLPYVTPLIEYWLEIPVNRQDFTCPSIPGNPDSCMKEAGASGMRQWITLGARILPPLDSLAIDIGVDFGLGGYAPTVHELAAQAPYKVIFGLSYNFDPFREKSTSEPPPPLVAPPPAELRPTPPVVIVGFVHDATSPDKAISGAVVTYLGHDVNPQITEQDGRFRSYSMLPGQVSVTVSANGYRDGSFLVDVPDPAIQAENSSETKPVDGSEPSTETESAGWQEQPAGTDSYNEQPRIIEVALDCPLKALPKRGTLTVRVNDENGNPVSGADIKLKGPVKEELMTSADGTAERELKPGTYSIQVEKTGYFKKMRSSEVLLNTRGEIEIQLTAKPAKARVEIRKRRIVIKKKIHFATGSDEIIQQSFGLMDEVADLMISHPEIKLVEIQGHTDNRGKRSYNLNLSERRAGSVKRYLVEAGVDGSRLEAKGFGPNRPKVPNITAQGRARNRRVEFHIREQE